MQINQLTKHPKVKYNSPQRFKQQQVQVPNTPPIKSKVNSNNLTKRQSAVSTTTTLTKQTHTTTNKTKQPKLKIHQ